MNQSTNFDHKPNFDHVYAVVLAGGSGTRFWPKSRHKTPKQLCSIGTSEKTMIQTTVERMDNFIPPSRRIVVTHQDQAPSTKSILGSSVSEVIAEPFAKNTAAALTCAAFEIINKHKASGSSKKAVMVSLHADHIIKPEEVFISNLKDAVKVADAGKLCLIGIKPKYPETGFGYIEQGRSLETELHVTVNQVESFREKPNKELAEEFLRKGNFYWNAGLFIWQCEQLLQELKEYCPQVYEPLASLYSNGSLSFKQIDQNRFRQVYEALPKIAIDHAVLEKSKNVAVVPSKFDWQDVGSWDALKEAFGSDYQGNTCNGNYITIDTKNCIIDSDGPLIATLGVQDLVIVASKGALLVCPKDRAQDVKLIVEKLQKDQRSEYL